MALTGLPPNSSFPWAGGASSSSAFSWCYEDSPATAQYGQPTATGCNSDGWFYLIIIPCPGIFSSTGNCGGVWNWPPVWNATTCTPLVETTFVGTVTFDFSLQDSFGTYYTPAHASWWWGGPVWGSQPVVSTFSAVPSTSLTRWTLTTTVAASFDEFQIQWVNMLPADTYTVTLQGATINGVSYPFSDTFTVDLTSDIWAGPPAINPCHQPSWYCDDYNCREIVYGGGTVTSPQISEADVLYNVQSFTTTDPANLALGQPVIFPYSDPGGIWDSLTSLKDISFAYGPVGAVVHPGQTTVYKSYSYTPLHHDIDSCIACCSGLNVPAYSSGVANPYYGMTTHPTPNPSYALFMGTYGYAQDSFSFTQFLFTQGINACGQNHSMP